MSRFYLHLRDGTELIEDIDGGEYSSLTEARLDAVKTAREIMATQISTGRLSDQYVFEIANHNGHILVVMPFSDAIERN